MEEPFERRVSRSKNRRSSILKNKQFPLEDMNPNIDELETETILGKKSRRSMGRRVSFAEKPQIKEFEKQPFYSQGLENPNEWNIFDALVEKPESQNESNSGQGVNFIELGGERRLNERVRDKQQRTKRKSFDIHDYIEQFEASDNTEETDDDSHTYIKDKSFYCDTVLFDNNDMELTCKVIGEFADHPSQIESDVGALSKSFVASEVNCDKENEIHVNHSWLEDANRQGHTTENASKRNQFNNQEAVGETTNGNKSICDSENWYRGMLEKASKTCNFKAPANDLSLIGEETEMQDLKSHHEMLRGIMEQLSVKNARIEPGVDNNRQPDSIIPILRREASQAVENQYIEGNDLDRTDKMMELPTPAMIGQVREGSAIHVLPPTKRAKLEADVAKEGNINDLGGNNAILTKEQSIFLPPATNDEQNSFQNEDKENVLPPILVRNSTLSSMSQSSIDNKEMLRGIMEQLSVKNARIEPRVEQNRQPDSIISILRREASQVVENQVLDGNDMDQTEKIIELPTPAMIGHIREGSAFHVPLPTKRVRLEADVTKEGNKSELDRNNSITIKEKSLFVPPAMNGEQNSIKNEDKENVLPPILVRNSTLSSMPQSSIDNKGSQDFDNDIKVQNEDSDKESLPQSILKQNANFHDVEHDAIFEDRNNSSFNSRAVDGIDVSSNAMQNEVQCDNVNMAYSLQTNQLILESQNGTVVSPDATQTNQEQEVVRADKEELLPAAKANIYEDIGNLGVVKLPDAMEEEKVTVSGVTKEGTTYIVSPELNFDRRRSETFYIPKEDTGAFTNDGNEAKKELGVKDVREINKTFTKRRETFVIPKMQYNTSPIGEGMTKPRFSIGDIKRKAKDRMSWVSREEKIIASTPLPSSPVKNIRDISPIMEDSSSSLEVTQFEKTIKVNGESDDLSDDKKIEEDFNEKADAISSQCEEKESTVTDELIDEEPKLDLEKDAEKSEETIENEPTDEEGTETEQIAINDSKDDSIIPNVEIIEENDKSSFVYDFKKYDSGHEDRITNIKRENVELEIQLAELRKKVKDKQKEMVVMDEILKEVMEERKERDRICNELEMEQQKQTEAALAICENENKDLERQPETTMKNGDESIASREILQGKATPEKKGEQEQEIQMVINHAKKQFFPWSLSTWSKSHFQFKLFRFKLTVEFEEMDESSLDYYTIRKWDKKITNITFGSSADGCNARSRYVASRMFRLIRSDSLIQTYKTTKYVKELLHEVSKITMAHRDLFDDLNSVYVNNNLTYVDDNTLETIFSSPPEILFTKFCIRCKINEDDTMPRMELSLHHLFGTDRTEMFQPIINKAFNEGPMMFSRVVQRVLDEIHEATITYLREHKTVN